MSLPVGFKIIDAHHHLWDLKAVEYPWLNARGVKRFFGDPIAIQKNYYPDDLRNDASPVQIAGSVHIQVGASDGQLEAQWIQSIDDTLPNAHVADIQLQAGNISHQLTTLSKLSKVRGVRQIIGRHPREDAKTGSGSLLTDPSWLRGLKVLQGKDLSFDLQLIAGQYERALVALKTVPGLPVAICHFGSPWDMTPKAYAQWKVMMQSFADLPKTVIKLSGFSMFKPNWKLDDIRPYVEGALDVFGADRCMFGSNFPVDSLHRSYNDILEVTYNIVKEFDEKAIEKVFYQNAKSFYRF